MTILFLPLLISAPSENAAVVKFVSVVRDGRRSRDNDADVNDDEGDNDDDDDDKLASGRTTTADCSVEEETREEE